MCASGAVAFYCQAILPQDDKPFQCPKAQIRTLIPERVALAKRSGFFLSTT